MTTRYAVALLVLLAAAPIPAQALRARLLEADLASPTGPAASLPADPGLLEGGGSGAPEFLALEACASMATGFLVSFVIGAAVSAVALVLVLSSGSAQQASLSMGAMLAILVPVSLASVFLVPLATAGVVTWLARGDGASPRFGRVYLTSLLLRLAFAGLNVALTLLTYESGSATSFSVVGGTSVLTTVLGIVGFLAVPIAEVYVANADPGSGGEVPARVPVLHRAEADRPAGTAPARPALPLLAFSF